MKGTILQKKKEFTLKIDTLAIVSFNVPEPFTSQL